MEEMNQDTPQTANTALDVETKAFGAPVTEGSADNNLTITDAFLSNEEGTSAPATPEVTPEAPAETTQSEPVYEAKNDEKRFEYWQSQAAKRENELKVLQQQLSEAKAEPATTPEVPAQQTQPATQEFPPPPSKPEKPRTFSRDEAYTDPSSESARYLDEVESWRDDMVQYNELKGQYDVAILQERLDAQEEERQKQVKQQKIQMDNQRQSQEIYEHVVGHYGFNEADARDFIQTMSKPESITMDNLVNLYRMQKGMAAQAPATTAAPSPAFTQTQNAQSIPSPMGVVTGESNTDTRSDSDQVMDDLINSFNSKNPWS
jgi:hypothetical protein